MANEYDELIHMLRAPMSEVGLTKHALEQRGPAANAIEALQKRVAELEVSIRRLQDTSSSMAMGFADKLKEARSKALGEAAYVARHACLIPPDGGAPTEAEAELCDEAARRILALKEKS